MEAFHKVIAVIIIGLLLLVLPIRFLARQHIEAEHSYLKNKANEFVNRIVEQGFMTRSEYQEFERALEQTGGLYNISMTHSVPVEGIKQVTKSPDIMLLSELEHVPSSQIFCFICNDSMEGSGVEEGAACSRCQNTPESILVFPEELWIPQNGEAELSVFITYMDGRLELLEEWECSMDTSVPGTSKAFVSAKGLIAEIMIHVEETPTEDPTKMPTEASTEDAAEIPTEPPTSGSEEPESSSSGNTGVGEGEVETSHTEEETTDHPFWEGGISDESSIYSYHENIYHNEIMSRLEEEEQYILGSGSYLTISVKIKADSVAGKILRLFFGGVQLGEEVACSGRKVP